MKDVLQPVSFEHPMPKGKIKVELFDESGNKEGEILKDNYVSPYAFSEFEKMLPYYKKLNKSDSETSSRDGVSLLYKVNGVILANNNEPIDEANHRFIRGEHIGYGYQYTTNSTSVYGSFNNIESVTNDTCYKKLVFDFPTSAGNGTFTDIYGLHFNSSYGRAQQDFRSSMPTNFFTRSSFSTYHNVWQVGNSYFTVLYKSSTIIELYRYEKLEFELDTADTSSYTGRYFLGKTDGSDAVKTQIVLPSAFNGGTWAFDETYFYAYDAGNRRLYRAPLNNLTNVTLLKTFTSAEIPETGSLAMAHNPFDNMLYLVYINDSSTSAPGKIKKISKSDYSVLSNTDIKPTQYSYTSCIFRPDFAIFDPKQKGVLITRGNIIDVEDNRIIYSAYDGNSTYTFYFGLIGNYLMTKYMIAGNQSFFSRVKLDSPVTKTSTQTMKITYEWTMPKPDLSL